MNIAFYLHDEKDPIAFEKQLFWFMEHYQLISAQDVYEYYYNGKTLKNACHLTIDDGWLSTYQVIFPILKKYDVPVSIFVSPLVCSEELNFWYYTYKNYNEKDFKDFLVEKKIFQSGVTSFPLDLIFKEMKIDMVYSVIEDYQKQHGLRSPERGFVNVEELREMSASGLVEIGAHTMIHPILSNETDERSKSEIIQSIEQLSILLDKPITSFAYPNGLPDLDFGSRETNTVKESGIKLAYTVQPGILNAEKNPLLIPRVGSVSRLRMGRLGLALPSLHDQTKKRARIKQLILQQS